MAVVAVLAVLALVIVLASGKKGKDQDRSPSSTSLAPMSTPSSASSTPQTPQRPPPPDLPPAVRAQAQSIAERAKVLSQEGEAIYEQAMAAKRASDDDLWQDKLEEASQKFYEIQDLWNELLVDVPTSDEWPDQEEVANYHLGAEGDAITRALGRLHDIQKQRRR